MARDGGVSARANLARRAGHWQRGRVAARVRTAAMSGCFDGGVVWRARVTDCSVQPGENAASSEHPTNPAVAARSRRWFPAECLHRGGGSRTDLGCRHGVWIRQQPLDLRVVADQSLLLRNGRQHVPRVLSARRRHREVDEVAHGLPDQRRARPRTLITGFVVQSWVARERGLDEGPDGGRGGGGSPVWSRHASRASMRSSYSTVAARALSGAVPAHTARSQDMRPIVAEVVHQGWVPPCSRHANAKR